MTKQSKAALVLAAAILSSSAGVTYAWLTAQDQVTNTLDVSKVETTIVEEYTPPPDPHPGTVVHKAPRVHSESDTDCFVRIRVVFTKGADWLCEPLSIHEGWSSGGDGYYYWKEALSPGQDTAPLFETVKFREDIDEADITPFDILVYSESVQAKGRDISEIQAAFDQI